MEKELYDRLEKKLDEINNGNLIRSKFDEIDKVNIIHSESLNRLESKVDKIETNDIFHINEKLDRTEVKIDGINKIVSSHNGKLSLLVPLILLILTSVFGIIGMIIKSGAE